MMMPPCNAMVPPVMSLSLRAWRESGVRAGGMTLKSGLLMAAALCLGIGFVMGYMDIHHKAERALALRLGPPAPVSLQHFDPDRDMGRVGEVVLRAEIDPKASFVLEREPGHAEGSMMVIPMLPVSDIGEAMLAGETGRAEELRADASTPASAPMAEGFLLVPLDSAVKKGGSPFHFASGTHGDGRFGTVVTINGEAQHRMAVLPDIKRGFAAIKVGLVSYPIVLCPYVEGRVAALSESQQAMHVYWFVLLAGGLALLTCPIQCLGRLWSRLSQSRSEGQAVQDDMPGPLPHPKFGTMPAQVEIPAAGLHVENPQDERRCLPRVLARLLRGPGVAER